MSAINELQDKVSKFLINATKDSMKEQQMIHSISLDPNDGTETEALHSLHKILIPESMNKLQGAQNLIKQFEEEETLRSYNRQYDHFFINDFMVALQILIPKYFGMLHVSKRNTEGRPASQDYIQIPIGYDEKGKLQTENGYVGSITAPCWEDAIIDIVPGNIIIRAKLKFERSVQKFLEDVESYIKQYSIVRGKAVTIEKTDSGLMAKPILPKTNTKIVLHPDVERVINNLIIPGLGDKSKTSLLFTGDFGTGKTETAIRVGMAGQEKYNRTFIYLHTSSLFGDLIPYIKNYQAATVFAEDVDQISAGDRDSSMNELLNRLDGNELKNVNCTFIFTTNNHDKIHPAMRRPGRIDQVVHFDYCTKEMVSKIYALYAEGIMGYEDINFDEVAEATPVNLQGALIAEISRRAVKYAERLYSGIISADRFLDAIASMKDHIKFMKCDQKKDNTMEHHMAAVFYASLQKAFPHLITGNVTNFKNSPYGDLLSKS